MIQSWPAWILAAAAAVAASRIASGGVFDDASTSTSTGIGNLFFGPQHHHGLPPLGPLAASFLLVVLGAGIGAASVVAGLVRVSSVSGGKQRPMVLQKRKKKLDDTTRTSGKEKKTRPYSLLFFNTKKIAQVFLLFYVTEPAPDVTEADARRLAEGLESEAARREAEEREEKRIQKVEEEAAAAAVLRGTEDEAVATSSPPPLPPPIPFAALAAELRAATAAARRPRPPHAHARRGRYGGWVWTVPVSAIPAAATAS